MFLRLGSWRLPALVTLAAVLLAACATGTTPPPAVGGDDKAIKDPDDLGKDPTGQKKGPTFYTADAPPPGAGLTVDPAGAPVPGGPVRLATASPGKRSVRLLSPGDAPLEIRVYSPKVGSKETLTIATKTATTASAGGQPLPGGDAGLPPTTFEIALVVKEVSDGQIKSEFVVRKAAAKAKSAESPTAKYAAGVVALKGAKGTVSTTRGGDAIAVQVDEAADDANKDLLRDHLLTPAVPFPEAPIGNGAKWEIRTPVTSDGMRTEHTVVYELTALTKGKGRVTITTTITAPEQDIEVPGAPVSPHLTRFEGTGKGAASVELSKVTARSWTLSSATKATISVSLMGTDLSGEMTAKSDSKRVGK